MGLIDFVKRAGKRLGIGGDDDKAPSADELRKEVESHGFDTKDVEIDVKGDEVELRGQKMADELREKFIVAVGNIAGVARVNDQIEAGTKGPEGASGVAGAAGSDFHTVAKGETLWGISKQHYGNGAHYDEIFEANRPMLSDPDKIYPGQVLRIPKR